MIKGIIIITFLILGLLTNLFANNPDSINIVLVSKKGLIDKSKINEFYSTDGIQLVTNGIYHFKVAKRKLQFYRIVRIWNDSISLAWTMDTLPEFDFAIKDIENIIFPSLNNGVSGFPHPTLSNNNYEFTMIQNPEIKLPKAKICLNAECNKYIIGYKFMTSGFGWKPIYQGANSIEMLDGKIIHKLKKK